MCDSGINSNRNEKLGERPKKKKTFQKYAPSDKSICDLHNNKIDMELWILCWALFLLWLFYNAFGS